MVVGGDVVTVTFLLLYPFCKIETRREPFFSLSKGK